MVRRRYILAFVSAALSGTAQAGEPWQLLSTEPDGIADQLPVDARGQLSDGDVHLSDKQFIALINGDAKSRSVAFISGPADISFDSSTNAVSVQAGRISFVTTGTAVDPARQFRLVASNVETPAAPLPVGVLSITATNEVAEIAFAPSGNAARPDSLRDAAPRRRLQWSSGKWTDAGELSADGQAALDARQLSTRAGIGAARRERNRTQRELVLNLLAVDTSAKVETIEKALQSSELRIVNATTNTQVASVTSSQSQPGVAATQFFGSLQFPGANSPANLASALEGFTADRRGVRSSSGRGFGTGGLGLLSTQLLNGAVPIGPGALAAVPR